MVYGFCLWFLFLFMVSIVKSDPVEKFPKIPTARQKNLWYPGYLNLRASSALGGVARCHSIATRERRRECEGWRPSSLSASPLARAFSRHSKCRTCSLATSVPPFLSLLSIAWGSRFSRAYIFLLLVLLFKGNQ